MRSEDAILELSDVSAGYGSVRVLENVSLAVRRGGITTIVGSNGAGKTTLLKTVSGLLHPYSGSIEFAGEDVTTMPPDGLVARGLLHVAEGRRLFRQQTVADNLELGMYGLGLPRQEAQARLTRVFSLFPQLRDKLRAAAGSISGGQQQMLAIAQALVREPKLLLLDEPSLGLAPIVIDDVLTAVVTLREEGTTILLVEQVVERALEISDYAYVLQTGRVCGEGEASSLAGSDTLRRAYLGAVADV